MNPADAHAVLGKTGTTIVEGAQGALDGISSFAEGFTSPEMAPSVVFGIAARLAPWLFTSQLAKTGSAVISAIVTEESVRHLPETARRAGETSAEMEVQILEGQSPDVRRFAEDVTNVGLQSGMAGSAPARLGMRYAGPRSRANEPMEGGDDQARIRITNSDGLEVRPDGQVIPRMMAEPGSVAALFDPHDWTRLSKLIEQKLNELKAQGALVSRPNVAVRSSHVSGLVAGTPAEAWADQVFRASTQRTSIHPFLDPTFGSAAAIKTAALLERNVRDVNAELVRLYGEDVRPHVHQLISRANEILNPPVKVTGEEFGRGLADQDLREAARIQAVAQFKGKVVRNANSGLDITIAASGIKHVKGVSGDVRKVKLLAALPQVLEKSRYIGPQQNFKSDPNVKQFHQFETHAQIGGELVRVDSVVRETHQGQFFYDWELSTIKKEPVSLSRDASGETGAHGPESGSDQNIAP